MFDPPKSTKCQYVMSVNCAQTWNSDISSTTAALIALLFDRSKSHLREDLPQTKQTTKYIKSWNSLYCAFKKCVCSRKWERQWDAQTNLKHTPVRCLSTMWTQANRGNMWVNLIELCACSESIPWTWAVCLKETFQSFQSSRDYSS